MDWHWPQYTYATFTVIAIAYHIAKEGEARTGTYGKASDFVGFALTIWILHMGGFW